MASGHDGPRVDESDLARDILGLYRAILDDDAEAAGAILSNTDCVPCLAVGAAQVGLWLAGGGEGGGHGYDPGFRDAVRGRLGELQQTIGRGSV